MAVTSQASVVLHPVDGRLVWRMGHAVTHWFSPRVLESVDPEPSLQERVGQGGGTCWRVVRC